MMIVFAKLLICIISTKIYIRYFSNFPKKLWFDDVQGGQTGQGKYSYPKTEEKIFSPRGYFFGKVV